MVFGEVLSRALFELCATSCLDLVIFHDTLGEMHRTRWIVSALNGASAWKLKSTTHTPLFLAITRFVWNYFCDYWVDDWCTISF